MATEFNIPRSSFEELQKILRGYGSAPDNSSLDALSKITGINPTVISQNNKFLSDIGLITGTVTKTATDLGKKLGRALDHKQADDCQLYWKEAVQTNEKVAGLVTTVRIKGGMSEKDLSDHVLYVSGQKNNPKNKTGARCVVDVLLAAGLLEEADGKLSVATSSASDAAPELRAIGPSTPSTSPPNEAPVASTSVLPDRSASAVPQVVINIQLHLPETEDANVYEKLFKALREHLLAPKG